VKAEAPGVCNDFLYASMHWSPSVRQNLVSVVAQYPADADDVLTLQAHATFVTPSAAI